MFLFNPHTGHTHILNSLALELLERCAETPLSGAALVQAASSAAQFEADEQFSSQVMQHIVQLEQLGLLERQH